MTDRQSQPKRVEFGAVRIATGRTMLAQQGLILVHGDVLTLLGDRRETIVDAPLSETGVRRVVFAGGRTLMLVLSGRPYRVSPGWGGHLAGPKAPQVAADSKAATAILLQVIAEGG